VGDLSPKGRVGDSRPAPLFGWQSDSKPFGNTNCQTNTESELPCGNVMVGENPSAKHHPPLKQHHLPLKQHLIVLAIIVFLT
jgi:hypothetical protein